MTCKRQSYKVVRPHTIVIWRKWKASDGLLINILCDGRATSYDVVRRSRVQFDILMILYKWWHRAVRHRIRPPARGEIWVIVDHRGESCIIVRCYTTSQLSKKQTQPLNNFSHIQKPSYNVRYCRGIVQSSRDVPVTSTFIIPYLHMLWCARHSHDVVHGRATYYDIVYEIAQPSYDCNCVQMLTSASRQTII